MADIWNKIAKYAIDLYSWDFCIKSSFREFVSKYYNDKPILPFTIPKGIELIRIDYDTGKVKKNFNNTNSVYEAFSKSDNLAVGDQTLVGSQGFQIIQIEENSTRDVRMRF